MHSSTLRGTDFDLLVDGARVTHAEFFAGFAATRRLGLISPAPLTGLGATALVMAHVTAFYDAYRARGDEFSAYPDFFTFQRAARVARYGMLDIWPERKDVAVGLEPGDVVDAVTDRGVGILLVPDRAGPEGELHPVQRAAVERLVETCYLYAADGLLPEADLVVSCPRDPVAAWMAKVAATVDVELEHVDSGDTQTIEQGYRRIGLEEALTHL